MSVWGGRIVAAPGTAVNLALMALSWLCWRFSAAATARLAAWTAFVANCLTWFGYLIFSAASGIGIGISVGLALLFSSVYQGMCAASGIQASAKQPAIIGKCFVALGIVESFSLFAFVFALLLIY